MTNKDDKKFTVDKRDDSQSSVEAMLRNEQQLKKFTDESGNTIKSLETLQPFEQSFVLHYCGDGQADLAYYKARKENGQPQLSKQQNYRFGNMLLMRTDIQNTIRDISRAKSNMIKQKISTIALGKLTDSFVEHSQRSESIMEIDRQIAILRVQEEKILNAPVFDLDSWTKLTDTIESKIRTKDKLQESVMKNAQFVINTATDNKEKTIVRAGSIQINLGNSEQTKSNSEIIEGAVSEINSSEDEEVYEFKE